MALVGCSPKAELSGDVFLTMESRTVHRVAGVEVLLVPDNEAFRASWTAAAEEARPKVEMAAKITSGEEDLQSGHVADGSFKALGDLERLRALRNCSETVAEAASASKDHVVLTDVNGRYRMNAVKRGRYFIVAQHEAARSGPLMWIVPCDLTAGGTRTVDLSNRNLAVTGR